MVVLAEVMRKAYLASIVPVIVNAVLNEHQVVVDIIAFVSQGDFPRSRLGEKQRGKILATWVTRKMRTIAQFSIRDPEGSDSQITERPEPRSVGGSLREGSLLRHSETVSSRDIRDGSTARSQQTEAYVPIPTDIAEMPANYESSIVESPPLPTDLDRQDNNTPTEVSTHHFHSQDHTYVPPSDGSPIEADSTYYERYGIPSDHGEDHDDHEAYSPTPQPLQYDTPPNPRYDSKPTLSLPSVTGHESFTPDGDLWTLPSQQASRRSSKRAQDGGGGRLRIANAGSGDEEDDDDWPSEAIMHMNLAGTVKRESRYDGSGYGDAF